jgi:acetyl-CoA acetyltransferase family protein
MTNVVILSAVRTPIGRIRGVLSEIRPDDLAAIAIREAVSRSRIKPGDVEEVYLGCANQAGEDNRNIGRIAGLLAGLPNHVAGVTVNRLCASGLNAVNQAARAILSGEGSVFVAGGVESMTRAPYSVPKNPMGFGPSGNVTGWDTTLGWRYPNSNLKKLFPLEAMGETAENIFDMSCSGEITGGVISRVDQDRFALQSHHRAVLAMNEGRFQDEMIQVVIPNKPNPTNTVSIDQNPRYSRTQNGFELNTDMGQLSALPPVFRPNGTVTAGNSSGLNDGASAVVLADERWAKDNGFEPIARWLGSAAAGVDPRVMGLGPVAATRKLMDRLEMDIGDIDLIEVNEAFAVQALAVIRELGISEEITNVNGGAIALGHPLGCSGARILTTLIHEMRRRKGNGNHLTRGLATLCVGVGQGEATVVELPD